MDVPEIDVATFEQRRADGGFVLDVRQPDEWDEAHLDGALLVPLGQLPERLGEVPREGTVHVICRSGSRSGRATQFLRAHGVDAVNVAGGMLAWVEGDRPVVTGSAPG